MLWSRRSVLQGLAATAASLALDPFHCVVTEGRRYQNLRLGLEVTLPQGWEFGSIADFASLRQRQDLLDEIEDEMHPLKDPDTLPVFLFEQPRYRRSHFVPAMVLYDEPLFGPAPNDEARAHMTMLQRIGLSYRDLEVIDSAEPIDLAGTSGTMSRWSYSHELDAKSYDLVVRTILVFRGDRAHTYHLVDRLSSPRIPDAVWQELIGSIRYSK